MRQRRPILVTGSHRSGTTWVGKMIAVSPAVTYIHEPFNLKHDPAICDAKFQYWYTYICESNQQQYFAALNRAIGLRYDLRAKLATCKNYHDVRKAAATYLYSLQHRLQGRRPLIKDPIAIFSAEWLAATFDMDVVVLIRHPAAFVGSLKAADWEFPFSHFTSQPELMRDHIGSFEDEVRRFASEKRDIVEQASLLWKIIYQLISGYKQRHPDWIYVRHEDLSRDPISGFRELFDRLDIPFSPAVADTIQRHSSAPAARGSAESAPSPLIRRVHRDSAANVQRWRERLTDAEVATVRTDVGTVAHEFYSDHDW